MLKTLVIMLAAVAGFLVTSPAPARAQAPDVVEWCVRHWELDFSGEELVFTAPNLTQTRGSFIDLRGDFTQPPNDSGPGLVQWGIFPYTVPQTGLDILACFPSDPDRPLRALERVALETVWEGSSLRSSTVGGALFEMLTEYGDPDLIEGNGGLMPNRDGSLNLYLGPGLVHSEPFELGVHPASDRVITTLQSNYRKIRESSLRGDLPADKYRQYLDTLARKYGTEDTDQFIPDDLPKESRLRARTSQTETWGCGDSDDPDCDLDWTELTGDLDISSNTGVNGSTSTVEARFDDAVSDDDNFIEADVEFTSAAGTNREMGITNRKECGTTTRTWYEYKLDDDSFTIVIRRRIAGSVTDLNLAAYNPAPNTTYDLRGDISGSDLEIFVDDASEGTASDGNITGFLCGGLRGVHDNSGDTVSWDNVNIDDGISGAARRRPIVINVW